MRTIIITGTPSTGKTILAKALSKKLNYKYIDVNKIINKYNISEGYDKKRKTKIVDINKLNKYLIKEIDNFKTLRNSKGISGAQKISKKFSREINKNKIKKYNGIIIDSHLSHHLPKKYVDLCIVTKCNLKTLEKRLKKRKYNKEKIRENLDAEIFDICLNEAREAGHNLVVIDTIKDIKTSLDFIVKK